MNNYAPKVSIVIPAYNASNYLAEAIDSALAQTYKNIEIIVVNDGSKDDGATENVALSYGDKIKYIRKENGGSSSALNTGILNMTGEWFSWLSHDDLYVPEKVARQIEYLNSLKLSDEEVRRQVLFSKSEAIDAFGKTIKSASKKASIKKAKAINGFSGNEYLIAEPTRYTFHGCSCLVHRSVFAATGVFDENLRFLNDYDMWFRVYAAGYKIHYLPEALVKGRVHKAQVSRSIGFSYHNPEQDMFWARSLDWLIENHPQNEELFFRFGRNAYLKTRNVDGDRAFSHIKSASVKKKIRKIVYKSRAGIRQLAKNIYLKLKT